MLKKLLKNKKAKDEETKKQEELKAEQEKLAEQFRQSFQQIMALMGACGLKAVWRTTDGLRFEYVLLTNEEVKQINENIAKVQAENAKQGEEVNG